MNMNFKELLSKITPLLARETVITRPVSEYATIHAYQNRCCPANMALVLEALEYDVTRNSNSRLAKIALTALNQPTP